MSAEFLLGVLIGGLSSGAFFLVFGIVIGHGAAVGRCVKSGFLALVSDKLQQAGVGDVVAIQLYIGIGSDDDDDDDGDHCCGFDPAPSTAYYSRTSEN